MYKLTICKCGTAIMQEGCCGNETIIFNCPCGEDYLKEITNKNVLKKKQRDNFDSCKVKGDKECHS